MWYTKYRSTAKPRNAHRYGPRLLVLVAVLLLSYSAFGEKIVIPTLEEYKALSIAEQKKLDEALGLLDTGAALSAQLVQPGEYDTSNKYDNFIIQWNRWNKMMDEAGSKGAIDYQEMLQWNRVVEAFEKLDKDLDKIRKARYAPGTVEGGR